jgi:DNA polymerase-3 subunit epsilon
MSTLQSKLRQLRSWQHKTLLQTAKEAGVEPKRLVASETGSNTGNLSYHSLSDAYGVSEAVLLQMADDEYEWHVCTRSGNPEKLPRMAQYLYRPLPEVARNLFRDGNFCVLDCETTSADPHASKTEIVEIAIVDEDGIPLVDTLIKPYQSIPNSTIHGITDEMVKGAPVFTEIYPKIARAIEGKTVLIYNSDYDTYLLDNLVNRNGLDMPHFESWCAMKAYADHKKRPGKYGNYAWIKLAEACQMEGVVLTDAHRALGDTLATYGLLKVLAEK